ncbi:Tripartite tricarboxylate transporter family receptor [compost metagenome]
MQSTWITRRAMLRMAAATAASISLPAMAQLGGGKKPLRVIVGSAAGGAADVIVRAMGPGIAAELKVPVVVDNRPGGQSVISLEALAAQPADGNTLLYIHSGYVATEVTQRLFDLDKSTIPLTRVGTSRIMLLVNGDSPFGSLGEMFDFARANPGKLHYGTLGDGGFEHLKMAQITTAAGVVATPVPYKTSTDAIKDLIGGSVDCYMAPAIFAKMYIPPKRVKALAIFDPRRWSDFPEVPTLREAGIEVAPLRYWGGYVARVGMPSEIVQRLSSMLGRVARLPEVRERFEGTGQEVDVEDDPEKFRSQIQGDKAWIIDAYRLIRT